MCLLLFSSKSLLFFVALVFSTEVTEILKTKSSKRRETEKEDVLINLKFEIHNGLSFFEVHQLIQCISL